MGRENEIKEYLAKIIPLEPLLVTLSNIQSAKYIPVPKYLIRIHNEENDMSLYQGRTEFRGKTMETPAIKTFFFDKPGSFDFVPGQHIVLKIPDLNEDPKGNSRIFSITSRPADDFISISTKVSGQNSIFKERLDSLEPGAEVEVIGPSGNFTLDKSDSEAVLVCGGIGITPFISIIRSNYVLEKPRRIVLIHSTTSREETPFREELDNIVKAGDWLRLQRFHTREASAGTDFISGHINAAALVESIGNTVGKQFYISGPPSFVEDLSDMLKTALKIDPRYIRTERFYGY
ncbi:Sulfhydrogenase 2 subunit gamma [Thermoplasmatales archaeon]|nr:Sulfhydrogenase 2 subunit gamma [Thermoplasmatales archaeon]